MDITQITGLPAIQNSRLAAMHHEADAMQAFMDQSTNLQDPTGMTYRLDEMDVYLSRLSGMLSEARALKDYAQAVYLDSNEDRLHKLSATVSNRMIKSALFEFNITVDRLETMYSAMRQIADHLQSQVSYVKQLMVIR